MEEEINIEIFNVVGGSKCLLFEDEAKKTGVNLKIDGPSLLKEFSVGEGHLELLSSFFAEICYLQSKRTVLIYCEAPSPRGIRLRH